MVDPRPVLDYRDQDTDKIIQQLKAYAKEHHFDENDPAANMLYHVFARLMGIALERLNRVPEKSAFAFLEAIGAEALPASAAVVPLSFEASADQEVILVPKGTLAGTKSDQQNPSVTFETEEDLYVVPIKLSTLITMDPVWDRFTDHGKREDKTEGYFSPFLGKDKNPHILYIGDDQLLKFSIPADVEMIVSGIDSDTFEFYKTLKYYYLSKGERVDVEPKIEMQEGSEDTFKITFKQISPIDAESIEAPGIGILCSKYWIKASQEEGMPAGYDYKKLKWGQWQIITTSNQIKPEKAFFNDAVVDTTTDFFPFGSEPKKGDCFYLGSSEVFSKLGGNEESPLTHPVATIHIEVPEDIAPQNPDGLSLSWECWRDGGWVKIDKIEDGTDCLRKTGDIEINQHIQCEVSEVNGVTNSWIRVRIAEGDYGCLPEYVPDQQKGFVVKEGTGNLQPPVISKITMTYQNSSCGDVVCQSGSFFYRQVNGNHPFARISDIHSLWHRDLDPALYIGFDKVFTEVPVTLYVEAMPAMSPGSVKYPVNTPKNPDPSGTGMVYIWEYFDGMGWKTLNVLDGSNCFTCSGRLEFLMPYDILPLNKFGKPSYLLRVRLQVEERYSGLYGIDPLLLKGIYINTIRASNRMTYEDQVIGSGNGEPAQKVGIPSGNILGGQEIWVREPELPTGEEYAAITEEEGMDAIQNTTNAYTGEPEIWIRWHEVPNLYASDAKSRHYTFDASGYATFGDGVYGMIPYQGINNVKAVYATGGGIKGNVLENTVCLIKSSLPGIASVNNPVAAQGGADMETLMEMMNRGVQLVRHGGRAVTAPDFEWIARQSAGPRIGKVKCFPNVNKELVFHPGWVTLLLVPQGIGNKLLPSRGLIRDVKENIKTRVTPALASENADRIHITGSGYIGVDVHADIIPKRMNEAQKVKKELMDALYDFFHPFKGGTRGQGWDFGHCVLKSEICSFLTSKPGVDRVDMDSLKIRSNTVQQRIYTSKGAEQYKDQVTILKEYIEVIQEKDPKQEMYPVKKALAISKKKNSTDQEDNDIVWDIISFREGDLVTAVVDLQVNGVENDKIQGQLLQPVKVNFPAGCLIKGLEDNAYTYIKTCTEVQRDGSVEIVLENGDVAPKKNQKLTVYYPLPLMRITSVTLLDDSKTYRLGIDACKMLVDLPVNTVITTPDHAFRLPLAREIQQGKQVTWIDVEGFKENEIIWVESRYSIYKVDPIDDIVYVDDNFLVYPGIHNVNILSP